MTGAMVFDRAAVAVEDGMTELVRGSETRLLDRLAPMVRRRSLALDLGRVERIDAAGITALIQLYRVACEAGNRFRVTNPSPHVGEILALVGLDRILLTPDTEDDEPCCAELAQSAA